METHGPKGKRDRQFPENVIDAKREDIRMYRAIGRGYQKVIDRNKEEGR